MPTTTRPHIYTGSGDDLMERIDTCDKIILLPDAAAHDRGPDPTQRIRIMWGQRLVDDVLGGHYRSLICAVNAQDNSHGFIAQIARLLPTSQWDEASITEYAKHFVQPHTVTVVKYDMDTVEVLAILRPAEHEQLTLDDLSSGFRMVSAMLHRRPQRLPVASVCFLGARANRLIDDTGSEPSVEDVLQVMYDSGYRGDVYPSLWMWDAGSRGVFARFPFPDSIRTMREGGF
ncbi:MAG: hypothetical protein WD768_21690 [Phycisphaeraceae bacterium]